MPGRLSMEDIPCGVEAQDLILRGKPNWTAVCFFAGLGSLHLIVCTFAFSHGHFEGYLSLMLGTGFSLFALGCYLTRSEIAVLNAERRIRLRTGYRGFQLERFVSFKEVRTIRLTLGHGPDHAEGLIEMVCAEEVIECPPTPLARQEALCLAVTIGVRLIKVSDERGFALPRAQ